MATNYKDEIEKKIYDDLKVWYLKDKNMSRLNALNTAGVVVQVMQELGQIAKGDNVTEILLGIAEKVFDWGFQDYKGSGVTMIADPEYDPTEADPAQGEIPF